MKKNVLGLQANIAAIMALVFCSQLGIFPQTSNAAPMDLNGSVTASNVAPYVRNAFVHDPSTVIKCKDEFWVFTPVAACRHRIQRIWSLGQRGPAIFTNAPPWVAEAVPANRCMGYWAPDVAYVQWPLSALLRRFQFREEHLRHRPGDQSTLDPNDPAYDWTDEGMVIQSATNDFNAIDPAIFHDTNGSLWLTFGSFWSGITNDSTRSEDRQTNRAGFGTIYYLAHYGSIEAPIFTSRDGYYYLFVNWGMCCRGANSTYNIRIGRHQTSPGRIWTRRARTCFTAAALCFWVDDGTYHRSGPRGHYRGQRHKLVQVPF